MSKSIRNLLVVLSALPLAGAALAQSSEPILKPFSIELGGYFPNFNVRNASEKAGIAYGIGYQFYKQRELEVGVAYRGSSFKVDVPGGDFDARTNIFELQGTYRLATPNSPWFQLGLGFGSADGSTRARGVRYNLSTGTVFTYAVGLGYDFAQGFYVAGRYTGASEEALRGFSVSLGYRF